ncbi:hypothetical protein [Rhodococcus cercidiphylli]|jgi:hypothetical protein|uniref:Uncharacterized protein n=1 Tax=Rhodococcus cercidiphylli TaxID=489916 RepID=A0ABU4AXC2_9NOCA|nr:hypothetical protein [Rhodococcus cercidiphylli]MDV6230874.1 hypothetical protein [Rhodococcus cercidiphylli]
MTETIPLPHGLNAILIPRNTPCPICGLTAEPLTHQHLCPTCTTLVANEHPIATEFANRIHDTQP